MKSFYIVGILEHLDLVVRVYMDESTVLHVIIYSRIVGVSPSAASRRIKSQIF